jgi:hypothetical protein
MDSRSAPAIHRAVLVAAMALAMALRLLSPAGFMPAFEHGAVTIVVCPDAVPGAMTMAHHHHHRDAAHQQPCPYAAAASVGPLPGTLSAILSRPIEPTAPPPATFVESPVSADQRHRPPATGPPLLPA